MKQKAVFKPEILAPAGDAERAYIAAEAGADAVYMGLTSLSARNAAKNIKPHELSDLVSQLHRRNVRSYITLNTILYEAEMLTAKEYLQICQEAKVDGIIIQDLAWLPLIADLQPQLEVHASTQMNIHSDFDIKAAAALNFNRIVLPRETSRDQLAEWSLLCQKLNLATEFFVHGAICMGVSGRCQMSFEQGGRSANRGACAQACRLRYQLIDQQNRKIDEGALLSAKDQSLLQDIPFFSENKISSLKIEGRMKDASYVRAATHSFRKAVDLWAAEQDQKQFQQFAMQEQAKLLRIFNRGGEFTRHSFENRHASAFVSKDFVGSHGIYLGKIKRLQGRQGIVEITKNKQNPSLQMKDIIAVRNQEKQIAVSPIGFLQEKQDVYIVKGFHPQKIQQMKIADQVFLLKDLHLEKALEQEAVDRYSMDLIVQIRKSEISIRAKIALHRENIQVEKTYHYADFQLIEHPIEEDRFTKQFAKLGNTAFSLKNIVYQYVDNENLPAFRISQVNDLRRDFINYTEKQIERSILQKQKALQTEYFRLEKQQTEQQHQAQRSLLSIANSKQLAALNKIPMEQFSILEISMLFLTNLKSNQQIFNALWDQNPDLEILIRLPEMMPHYCLKLYERLRDAYKKEKRIGFSGNSMGALLNQPDIFQLKQINEQANIINKESLYFYLNYTDADISISPEWNDQSLSKALDHLSAADLSRIFIPNQYLAMEMFLNYCPVGKNTENCRKCVVDPVKQWSQVYQMATLQRPFTKHQLITYPVYCLSQLRAENFQQDIWQNLPGKYKKNLNIRTSNEYLFQ